MAENPSWPRDGSGTNIPLKDWAGPDQIRMDEPDPWKHRSKNLRCDTCMWFVGKEPINRIGLLGRCRRHAPTLSGFPVVYTSDWCGDHKLDENKVVR
jgi:hypothetical protein